MTPRLFTAGSRAPVSSRWALVSAGLVLAGCTLTEDEFAPIEGAVSLNPVAEGLDPDSALAGAGQNPTYGGESRCNDSSACPTGWSCLGDMCVMAACVGAEDMGACVEACLSGDCAADPCSDGQQGPAETDVDCGGACGPCAGESACVVPSDCANGSCVAGVCASPTCSDRIANQDESGPDCGGSVCGRCGVGQACNADTDCQSLLFCPVSTRSCSPTSCQDGVQNGDELVTDCGGGECPGCALGSSCNVGTDCISQVCGAGSVCVASSCTDAVRNQDETDTDCGGSCTAACATGRACTVASDCAEGVCGSANCAAEVAQCCQPAACGDGVANGSEPVVDCGNAQCGLCAVGSDCTQNGQCQSGRCSGGACQVPLVCGDGQQNGTEGGVDCGGTEAGCPRCGNGQTCRVDADCQSSTCAANGRCVSCSDGLQNGDEGGVDCGGIDSGCVACPRCNEFNSTDLGTVGSVTTLPANGCARITQFPSYPPTLIESVESGPFPMTLAWTQACTGQSGASSFDRPYHQRALTGLSVSCPVVFELRGSSAPLGIRFW